MPQTLNQEFPENTGKLTQGFPRKIASIPGARHNPASAIPGMKPEETMAARSTLVPGIPTLSAKERK